MDTTAFLNGQARANTPGAELPADSGPSVIDPSVDASGALAALLKTRPAHKPAQALPSTVIGELLALTDEGTTACVRYPGQAGTAALRARTLVDLGAANVGHSVALSFEDGDPARPLVIGVIRSAAAAPPEAGGLIELDADGKRMVLAAREQLVLRCGKACITLTKAGKVLVEGTYVSSRSSGVNRLKGGSIQLN